MSKWRSLIEERSIKSRRSAVSIFFTSPFPNQSVKLRNPNFIPTNCVRMDLCIEQEQKLGHGKNDTQNGDILIQEKADAISRKISPLKLSTAKFEDKTVTQDLGFTSQMITADSLQDSGGQNSIELGIVAMSKSKHVRGFSLDENDPSKQFRSSLPDSSPRVNGMAQSPNPGRTPTRVTGRGALPLSASPFWERKVSTSGNQGTNSSTPGRRLPRAIICGEASPDNSPIVPKFGDWDESNPSASEGFTQVFDQVREQRQNGGGTITPSTNEPSSQSRQRTFKSSEGCWCFRWVKR